ncbi:MAG: hypothetical protein DCO95_16985 [Roseivirga sp. XM-24bin3]|nr:MAG: hypothetical protein DCO95_16985 [Roseivirga sp. XM-24bin3]
MSYDFEGSNPSPPTKTNVKIIDQIPASQGLIFEVWCVV